MDTIFETTVVYKGGQSGGKQKSVTFLVRDLDI